MSDLMYRIKKYTKVEDETKPVEQKEMKSSRSKKEKGKGKRLEYTEESKLVFEAINTVFNEPIFRILPQIHDKSYFRRPKNLLDYPGKQNHKDYCSYHQDKRHCIGSCRSLRFHLEDLVREGYLKEFIDEVKIKFVEDPPRAQWGDQIRRREEVDEEDYSEEARLPPRAWVRRNVQRPVVIHVIDMKKCP